MKYQRNFESNFVYVCRFRGMICVQLAVQQVHCLTGFQAPDLIFINLYTQKFINFTKAEVHTCYAVLIL